MKKKSIFLQKKTIFKDLVKYKQNIIFYPDIKIKDSHNFLLKLVGKLFLNKWKFSINYFSTGNIFCISSFKLLGSLKNKQIKIKVIENNLENKEELREFLISISKNYILNDFENEKNNGPCVLIIFPNQTFLIQLIRKFSQRIKKKIASSLGKKNYNTNKTKFGVKLKYGKFIMPADHRNNFKDGEICDIIVYGKIKNKCIEFSKSFACCNIVFTTLAAIKKKKKSLIRFLKTINICWIDSLDIILMQNLENFFFFMKNLIKIKGSFINLNVTTLFEIFIISTRICDFCLKFFSSLSFSGSFVSKFYKKILTIGIVVFSKKYEIKKNSKNNKIAFSPPFRSFEFKISEIFQIKGTFNLLIFSRKYSEIIPIRNILQKIKKRTNLKIILFNEYIKNLDKTPPELKLKCALKEVTLITEKWFLSTRYLFNEHNWIYFHTFPDNKEIYYELLRQVKF
jgi:hypothetical protein